MTRKKPKASNQTTDKATKVAFDTNHTTPKVFHPASFTAPASQKAVNGQGRLTPALTVPSTLLISRNKHTRYISSYHGPWLSLPPEVLDNLAHSNYYCPRPRPIDPAVFFDLVKIRRLIDDATSLAVRAANGTTSSSLHASSNATNGIFNGADAEILGIGSARAGGYANLSRERKHRMREHATQKLSHAYRLDEIASSVAMMQSATALEDVAKHVLQRDEQNADAQYVHFFHERIPSMAMAEYTSLGSLTEVIRQKPTDPSPFRTRAVTRTFKNDFEAVVRDCTEGLTLHKLYHTPRQNEQRDLIFARDAARLTREHRSEGRLEEQDHPSSVENQLLLHRGNAYLTLACDNIGRALYGVSNTSVPQQNGNCSGSSIRTVQDGFRADARRLVRTNAKRALRDYLAFMSHLDYTPGLSADYTEAFLETASSGAHARGTRSERLLGMDAHARNGLSEALVKYEAQKDRHSKSTILPQIPKPAIYKLNELFTAVPPAGVPLYPSDGASTLDQDHPIFSLPDFSEAVTYHPLLTEVLHSVLLCHCLIQTSTKELQRHAYIAARIARVCDGYPIFLAARSPARADWIEILRCTKNWLGLSSSWDALCAPAPDPGNKPARSETAEQKKARIKQAALIEALADERVVDGESFAANLKARERRAAREEEEASGNKYNRPRLIDNAAIDQHDADDGIASPQPKRRSQDEGKDYHITTERAQAILQWILKAPVPTSVDGAGRSKRRTGAKRRPRKQASTASSLREATETGLEWGLESLDMVD